MNNCFVYTITDPRDLQVKYVGITTNIKNRFSKHNSTKQSKEGILKRNWILKLKKLQLNPIFDIIDEGNIEYCQNAETNYIKLYKSFGAKLKNQLKTGFLFEHTEITKKKISDKNKGRKNTLEQINNLKNRQNLNYWSNKKFTEEHINNISLNRKGIPPKNKGLFKIGKNIILDIQLEYKNNNISQLQLAKKYNISKSSIDRYLKIKI
jgi:hypothetical protein